MHYTLTQTANKKWSTCLTLCLSSLPTLGCMKLWSNIRQCPTIIVTIRNANDLLLKQFCIIRKAFPHAGMNHCELLLESWCDPSYTHMSKCHILHMKNSLVEATNCLLFFSLLDESFCVFFVVLIMLLLKLVSYR